MKLAVIVSVFLALLATESHAFSAVAPKSTSSGTSSSSPDPVDKSMRDVDSVSAFDPTDGEQPALIRNNNDGVWVPQVRSLPSLWKLSFLWFVSAYHFTISPYTVSNTCKFFLPSPPFFYSLPTF
jgi:hypothetical protein